MKHIQQPNQPNGIPPMEYDLVHIQWVRYLMYAISAVNLMH